MLAVFGPVDHYVSPTWYPSKAEHHRTVPTWNYLVVHAHGELVIHDDRAWTRAAVARLTNAMESGRDVPWRVGMAPKEYVDERARPHRRDQHPGDVPDREVQGLGRPVR